MRYTYIRREFPRTSPIASALVIVAGAVIITVALILGFFAFLALSALVLVSGAVMALRAWWLGRRQGGQARKADAARGGRRPHGAIEGEYRVVREERDQP